jgi:hypothetical protein
MPDGVQDYEMLEAIGRGSYAKVYRGRHKRTDKIVAIKCINMPDRNGLPSNGIREITMLQELRHPHVVRYAFRRFGARAVCVRARVCACVCVRVRARACACVRA